LELDADDLFLIHAPWGGQLVETYRYSHVGIEETMSYHVYITQQSAHAASEL